MRVGRRPEQAEQTLTRDIDAEIRHDLHSIYNNLEQEALLRNPLHDPATAKLHALTDPNVNHVLTTTYTELAAKRAEGTYRNRLSLEEHAKRVQALERNERSTRAIALATDLASRGRFTVSEVTALARLEPTRGKRERLAADALSEYIRTLDTDPYSANASQHAVCQQLGAVHKAIDLEPTPERNHIRRVADLIATNDRTPGMPLPRHIVSTLQESAPRTIGQRNPNSPDDLARKELIDIIVRRQEQPGLTVSRRNDFQGLLFSLDGNAAESNKLVEPKPQPDPTEPSMSRKAAASVALLGASGGLAGGLTAFASSAAASPNKPPAASSSPVKHPDQHGQGDITASTTARLHHRQVPISESPQIDVTTTPLVGPSSNTPPGMTLPASNLHLTSLQTFPSIKTNPLPSTKLGENTVASPVPNPDQTQSSHTIEVGIVPDTSDSTGSTLPPPPIIAPGTRTVRIAVPSMRSTLGSSRLADSARLPLQVTTPLGQQQQVVPLSVESLGTPSSSQMKITPPQLAPSAPEQVTSPTTDPMNVYSQMVQQGASLTDRVNQLQDGIKAAGGVEAPFSKTAAAIQAQAELLETAAQNNASLSDQQRQQIRRQLDTAVVLVIFPSYLQNANVNSLVSGTNNIYANAVAKSVYSNPATYGANIDPTLQVEMSQVDPTIASTVSNLFANADALLHTPEQQLHALQNIDPTAATALQTRLTQLAQTALNQPSSTPPRPRPSHGPVHSGHPTRSSEHPTTPSQPEAVSSNKAQVKRLVKFGVPRQYAELYVKWGNHYAHVTPEFLAAQGKWESGFNKHAISSAGAKGVAQFMDGTWAGWAKTLNFPANASPYDPEYAIHAQAAMMNALVKHSATYANTAHQAELIALAGYNLGFGTVENYHGMPPHSLIGNYATGIEEIKSQILSVSIQAPQAESRSNASHKAGRLGVGNLLKKAKGPFEYTMEVPNKGSGHDAYYSNQIADALPGIDGESACGVYSIGSILASLTGEPTKQAIVRTHEALGQAGAYADGQGMLNSVKMLNVIQNQLGLNVNVLQFERASSTLSDDDMAKIRNALEQNDHGTPTMILVHTSKLVSKVLGNTNGNFTSGHFLYMYAYKGNGGDYKYYVGNPGNRLDTPPKGHGFTQSEIEGWLDGAYVVSLPKQNVQNTQ